MFGFNLIKLTSFLLLINLLLIPVLTMPNPESYVPMNLNPLETDGSILIKLPGKRRRRRGSILKGIAAGALLGGGAILAKKALTSKKG
ncbi:hypothetical protein Mgra_00000559 [Meloidogyne graminicola]|uniref:Uncharacterized protein n=1 Tax=Meloidogyne graminicola TaxID=189291 RepID=A0A8T0A5B8_9BILA|nr:hypothetical protein Mgra_00000559 [Meloidogyne graminicola]